MPALTHRCLDLNHGITGIVVGTDWACPDLTSVTRMLEAITAMENYIAAYIQIVASWFKLVGIASAGLFWRTGATSIVTLVALGLFEQKAPASLSSSVTSPITYQGFMFSPGQCKDGESDCLHRGPKAWKQSEIDTLKKSIDEIRRSINGRDVTDRAQTLDAATLQRFTRALVGGTPVPAIGAALRRDRTAKGIDLYDRVFISSKARDKYSGTPGYLLVAHTLLHECFHAIDNQSLQTTFAELVGFVDAGGRWRFAIRSQAEAAALTQFDNELLRMEQSGDFKGEADLNRRLALAMRPVRFPTMLSTSGPAEAFAEIGAHLILDPNARDYLPRPVVDYFVEKVFRRPL
jgi:hypothetical protein